MPQAQALVVESWVPTWAHTRGHSFPGSFIDRVAKKVNLKEQVEDFPPQPVITKDNVTMQIDTVVFSHYGSEAVCLWRGAPVTCH